MKPVAQIVFDARYDSNMTPVAWMDSEGTVMSMPEIEHWCPPHTMLYTSDQLREAQVKVLREAADAISKGMAPNKAREMIRRMADELEKADAIRGLA